MLSTLFCLSCILVASLAGIGAYFTLGITSGDAFKIALIALFSKPIAEMVMQTFNIRFQGMDVSWGLPSSPDIVPPRTV